MRLIFFWLRERRKTRRIERLIDHYGLPRVDELGRPLYEGSD